MDEWQQIRAEFPALSQCVWLNTATFGQVPLRAQKAIQSHYEERNLHGGRWFLRWFQEADDTREDIARLFGVGADDVAFVPNANHALSLLVNSIDWKPGDEILTFENEFPNQVYTASLVEDLGVSLRVVPLPQWREALGARTRLVALSQTNYSTGENAPLGEITRELRGRGILLYADGTQTAGVRQVRFPEGMPDLYAVNCYKWMNAPPGAAFMLVPAHTREWLRPRNIGWRSHKDWRNVNQLHLGRPEFSGSADRYEGGMLPFTNLAALRESVRILHETGLDRVEQRVLALASQIREHLAALGAEIRGEANSIVTGHILAARLPGVPDPGEVARALEARDVHVSARLGFLRVSPHYYNNEQDVERFATALREVLGHA